MGAELFEADGWTDSHDEAKYHFPNCVNTSEKEQQTNGQKSLINQEHNTSKRSTPKNLNYWPSTFVAVQRSSNLLSLRGERAVMMQTHPGSRADVQCIFENIWCYHNYELPS